MSKNQDRETVKKDQAIPTSGPTHISNDGNKRGVGCPPYNGVFPITLGACAPGAPIPDAAPILFRVVWDKIAEYCPGICDPEKIANEIVYEFREDYAAVSENAARLK